MYCTGKHEIKSKKELDKEDYMNAVGNEMKHDWYLFYKNWYFYPPIFFFFIFSKKPTCSPYDPGRRDRQQPALRSVVGHLPAIFYHGRRLEMSSLLIFFYDYGFSKYHQVKTRK